MPEEFNLDKLLSEARQNTEARIRAEFIKKEVKVILILLWLELKIK